MKKSKAVVRLVALSLSLGFSGGGFVYPGDGTAAETTATPVVAGQAHYADVPTYLTGLGTVQPFNSVLIKSRVDGQIVKIAFTEGQEVQTGDLIAEIDPRPYAAALAVAEATKAKDQALLQNAELDLQRYRTLASHEQVARQQLDTQTALVAEDRAVVDADQAQIDLAALQVTYCSIRSPIDGRVGTRLVDNGNIVKATDTTGIVTINQIKPISVRFSLPATSLIDVRAAARHQALSITADDGNGHDLATGTLAVIDNQVNTASATVTYKATFDNTDETLWPGQFVNVRLLLAIKSHVLVVPMAAVVSGPDGPYVFVIGTDKVIAKRPIVLDFSTPILAIVKSGLADGDAVVTDGQYRIQAGSRVTILATNGTMP